MLYEKLNTDMQELVDAYAERLRPLSWPRRSDALGQAALPLGDQFSAEQARLVGKGFVTAVLERLPEDEVTDAHQAVLFSLSLNPFHRASADAFLAAHPEVHELVQRALGDDGDDEGETGGPAPADA